MDKLDVLSSQPGQEAGFTSPLYRGVIRAVSRAISRRRQDMKERIMPVGHYIHVSSVKSGIGVNIQYPYRGEPIGLHFYIGGKI